MKEKRILAMFITSVITLVASLAVTFGVLQTLADPVVATAVYRYNFTLGETVDPAITVNDDTLKIKEDIVFQPADKIVWSDNEDERSIWFNDNTYNGEIVYFDETISTKLKVIPLRVSNKYNEVVNVNVNVTYDKTSMLGKYTVVKIYDFNTGLYIDASSISLELSSAGYHDYAIVVFADDSYNTEEQSVNFGTDLLNLNVEITKTTATV